MDDERNHDVGKEGDEIEETDEATQNIEGILPPVEETRESEQEPATTDIPESDEEENSQDDDSDVPVEEEETHNSGYNLRKRNEVNYRETRKYNSNATVLYQYGEVSRTKENLIAKVTQERRWNQRTCSKSV